jgi:hypothetical protein
VFDDHHKTCGLTSLPRWSFLRCIKFMYIYKEKGPLDNSINMEWIRLAPAYGAPNCLVCIGQCPVPRLVRPTNRLLSGKLSAPQLKFTWPSGVHQTVRWAHGQRSSSLTVDCYWSETLEVRNSQRRPGRIGLFGVPPNCPVRHWDRRIQRSTPMGDWRSRHQTMNSVVSGAHWTVRCARRQKATSNG